MRFSVPCLSSPITPQALQHSQPLLLGMSLLPDHQEPTWLASQGVAATSTTQIYAAAEVQPVSFRGELLKSTENMVAL